MSYLRVASLMCPVAERRRKARSEDRPSCGRRAMPSRRWSIEGRDDRQDLLGQGMVRQPRALQRLRESPAARPHLCPQRLGGGPADRKRRGRGDGQRLRALRRSTITIAPVRATALESHLHGLRGHDRLAGRAAAGPALQGRDGPGLPRGRRAVSRAQGDRASLQLPGLGRHVQARRGGALWRRRPARREARSCCSCCAASTKTNCSANAGEEVR